MKSPWIRRSRLETQAAKWHDRLSELERAVAEARKAAKDASRVSIVDRREAEKLRSALADLGAARSSEQRWLREVESIAETRERQISVLQAQLSTARAAHSAVLAELAGTVRGEASEPRPQAVHRGRNAAPIPVVLGFDLEPDDREVDRRNPTWSGADGLLCKLPEVRERICTVAAVPRLPLSWFIRADPQIEACHGDAGWALTNYREERQRLIADGDEIGLHVHPWRWDEAAGAWCQDHADDNWLGHCVEKAVSKYREIFGTTPPSYRGGDRFLNRKVLEVIEAAGVQVDLSVERMPGVRRLVDFERCAGELPDFSGTPQHAYWPSVDDLRRPGTPRLSGLGLMPLTAYPAGTLNLWVDPEDFENALVVRLQDRAELTHLAFVARSDAGAPESEPVWESICRNIATLARLVRDDDFEFTTATTAWTRAREWLLPQGAGENVASV